MNKFSGIFEDVELLRYGFSRFHETDNDLITQLLNDFEIG